MPNIPNRAIELVCPPVNGSTLTGGAVVVGMGVDAVDVPLTETAGQVAVVLVVPGVLAAVVVLVPDTLTPGLVAVTLGVTVTMTVGVAVALVDVLGLVDVLVDTDVLGLVDVLVDSDVLGLGLTHGTSSTVHGKSSQPAMSEIKGGSNG